MTHVANWYAGWSMILGAFVVGAVLGLFFAREDFLGGYGSWSRRLLRLGHIALAALGLFNLVFAMAPLPAPGWQATGTSFGLMIGGAAMPAICFLSAWRPGWRALFFIPVTALIGATICALAG